jgi:hypothetical protein
VAEAEEVSELVGHDAFEVDDGGGGGDGAGGGGVDDDVAVDDGAGGDGGDLAGDLDGDVVDVVEDDGDAEDGEGDVLDDDVVGIGDDVFAGVVEFGDLHVDGGDVVEGVEGGAWEKWVLEDAAELECGVGGGDLLPGAEGAADGFDLCGGEACGSAFDLYFASFAGGDGAVVVVVEVAEGPLCVALCSEGVPAAEGVEGECLTAAEEDGCACGEPQSGAECCDVVSIHHLGTTSRPLVLRNSL